MAAFEYRRAASSDEALALASASGGRATLLAGGTDVIPLLKDEVIAPRRLVDIKRLADLNGDIRIGADGVSIGALATLADIAGHPELRDYAPLLGQAAATAATPQLRNVATLGGNLLQRPRCWYFRDPAFHCWLAGGETCHAQQGRNDRHAIFEHDGGSPCCAVHPSDLAPCLLALDAEVLLREPDGAERVIPVAKLFAPPTAQRRNETLLGDALLVEIRLPKLGAGTRTTYRKAMARATWSFALSSVALRLDFRGEDIADVRVVLGGVANLPWRAGAAEAELRGAEPSAERFERAARLAVADARPLSHNAYKVPLTRALVHAALQSLGGDLF